jgi:hypothetical protein
MTVFVVYVDSNPTNGVLAWFVQKADAEAFAATLPGGSDVREAEIDSYRLVTEQTITLPV